MISAVLTQKPTVLEGLEEARKSVQAALDVLNFLERVSEVQGLRLALSMIDAKIAHATKNWQDSVNQEFKLQAQINEARRANDEWRERMRESPWED